MNNLSSKLETVLVESMVAVTPVPFNPDAPAIDPDTFSGMAGLSPSRTTLLGRSKKSKCNCTDCDCQKVEVVQNQAPVNTYRFVGKINNGADKDLAHGYHHTKFFSLLQKMVAPLPLVNKPSGIEVVASPALEKGLKSLATKHGLETIILEGHCNESDCHCSGHGKTEGHCK